MRKSAADVTELGGEVPTNGAADTVEGQIPTMVRVQLTGTTDMLFKRWNCESVKAKSEAAKGSQAKKTDDLESYVYRNDANELCVPGEYVRQAVINAARYRQDPRSPRKSAMDLFKAGVVSLTALASLHRETWDYEDRRRVVVQRNAVTRARPAIRAGWTAEFELLINLPEYIRPTLLHSVLNDAGRLVGLGDFRPSYGRFNVSRFEPLLLD